MKKITLELPMTFFFSTYDSYLETTMALANYQIYLRLRSSLTSNAGNFISTWTLPTASGPSLLKSTVPTA